MDPVDQGLMDLIKELAAGKVLAVTETVDVGLIEAAAVGATLHRPVGAGVVVMPVGAGDLDGA
jgi:hypothetical protein